MDLAETICGGKAGYFRMLIAKCQSTRDLWEGSPGFVSISLYFLLYEFGKKLIANYIAFIFSDLSQIQLDR